MDQALPWHSGELVPNAGGGLAMGYAPERPEPPVFKNALKAPRIEPLSPWRVWAAGFGGSQTLRGDGNDGTAGSSNGVWGGVFGIEKRMSNWLTAGVAIGGSDSNFSVNERSTSGKATGGHIAGYATVALGQTYLSGLVSYSHQANTTTRTVSILALNETLQGKFGSDQVGTRIELGHRMAFNSYNVTPFVAVQYSRLWQSGFSETPTAGAGVFALTLPSQNVSSLPAFVGVQFDKRYVFGSMVFSPYLRASWVHEFDPARQIDAAFTAVPGASFTVDGPRVASNSGKLDLGAKVALTRSTTLFGDFSSEFSERGHSFGGTGGVKVIW
jgi:outer membrane autotransporter protein